MTPDSIIVVALTRPWLWAALLGVRLWWGYYRTRSRPHIFQAYLRGTSRPGDLCYGGSDKTSGTEQRVRGALSAAGFRLLPASVIMVAPLVDDHGNYRKFTPDILLVHGGRRIVVEVDPYKWHGEAGPDRIYHDVERNRAYAACGWAIVRVRIGWPKNNSWARLGRYDVVLPEPDFYPAEHSQAVISAVNKARRVSPTAFDQQLARLQPYSGK